MICAGHILKPKTRYVEDSLQGDFFEVIMNIVHHHFEGVLAKKREVHCFVKLKFSAFKDERNDSTVLVKSRYFIFSEISSIIVAQVRANTKERSVLGKADENELQNVHNLGSEVVLGDPERHP